MPIEAIIAQKLGFLAAPKNLPYKFPDQFAGSKLDVGAGVFPVNNKYKDIIEIIVQIVAAAIHINL